MPTLKPRVQVTLEPHTHEVIERLSILQGRTRGSIIAELLDSIAPTLGRTVALLEAAQAAPGEVKRGLRAVVEDVHREIIDVAGDTAAQLDFILEALGNDDAAGAVDPHLVTRGSGIPPHAEEAASPKPRKRSKPGGSANG